MSRVLGNGSTMGRLGAVVVRRRVDRFMFLKLHVASKVSARGFCGGFNASVCSVFNDRMRGCLGVKIVRRGSGHVFVGSSFLCIDGGVLTSFVWGGRGGC